MARASSRTAAGLAGSSRFRRPAWREPRLLIGLGLIAVSVAATTAAVAYGDSTEPYAVAARDLEVGEVVTEQDLRSTEVRLDAAGDAYLSGDRQLEPGTVVIDRVPSGQLVPVGSLGREEDLDRRPIGIALSTPMPTGTEPGDLVDVWVAQRDRTGGTWSEPAQILEGAELAGVEAATGGLAGDSGDSAQVLVPAEDVQSVVTALTNESRITLVPHVGGAA